MEEMMKLGRVEPSPAPSETSPQSPRSSWLSSPELGWVTFPAEISEGASRRFSQEFVEIVGRILFYKPQNQRLRPNLIIFQRTVISILTL